MTRSPRRSPSRHWARIGLVLLGTLITQPLVTACNEACGLDRAAKNDSGALAVICEPVSGAQVRTTEAIAGRANLPAGKVLRLVVYSPDAKRFYPQEPPLAVGNDGLWDAKAGFGGDAGTQLRLLVVGGDAAADEGFARYLTGCRTSGACGGMEALPAGIVEVASTRVHR